MGRTHGTRRAWIRRPLPPPNCDAAPCQDVWLPLPATASPQQACCSNWTPVAACDLGAAGWRGRLRGCGHDAPGGQCLDAQVPARCGCLEAGAGSKLPLVAHEAVTCDSDGGVRQAATRPQWHGCGAWVGGGQGTAGPLLPAHVFAGCSGAQHPLCNATEAVQEVLGDGGLDSGRWWGVCWSLRCARVCLRKRGPASLGVVSSAAQTTARDHRVHQVTTCASIARVRTRHWDHAQRPAGG